MTGTNMFNLQSKCANPECPTLFDLQLHGKFYRFNRDPVRGTDSSSAPSPALGHRDIEHFWLCEPCSVAYTLTYEVDRGIQLRPRWAERPTAQHEELSVA